MAGRKREPSGTSPFCDQRYREWRGSNGSISLRGICPFSEALAESEGLTPQQVLFGIGSGDVINAAICAFTSSSRPLITGAPTYEIPVEFARKLGSNAVQIRLADDWQFPVKELADEAAKAGGRANLFV